MKSVIQILLALLLTVANASGASAEAPFTDGDRILFLGDSITQNGQYVALAEAYLWAAHPDRSFDIINAGLSSETVSGITEPVHPNARPNVHSRLERALELTKPQWVVVCYGMNDGIYHPESPRIVDAFRQGMERLVDVVAKRDAKLILLTPPSFDIHAARLQPGRAKAEPDEPYGYRNPFAQYDQTLERLGEIVKSLDQRPGVERVIDVHAATDAYLQRAKAANPQYVYGDGVHPPADGHLVMAIALLGGLGYDTTSAEGALQRLTGLTPADRPGDASDQQKQFHERLLARFNQRSAACRKAVGSGDEADIQALAAADASAKQAEEALRAAIAEQAADLGAFQRGKAYERYAQAAQKRWGETIAEIEKLDQSSEDPEDAVLFIGSSSIKLWASIDEDMAPYAAIQRGYGGARFSDLAVFAERLITPHQYRALVVFVGNDVTAGPNDLSLEEIEQLARHVVGVSKAHLSDAAVLLVEVTPTSSRFAAWPKIRQVNYLLREIALTEPNTYFVDTAEYYLDADNQPVDRYFRADRLHQNQHGYAIWAALIKRRLDEVFKAQGKAALVP